MTKQATWNIYDCGKSVSAETVVALGEYEKIHAFMQCDNRIQADSLISLFATLKEK
jgi:hypothetical protein